MMMKLLKTNKLKRSVCLLQNNSWEKERNYEGKGEWWREGNANSSTTF